MKIENFVKCHVSNIIIITELVNEFVLETNCQEAEKTEIKRFLHVKWPF